jgi:mycothiol synthase
MNVEVERRQLLVERLAWSPAERRRLGPELDAFLDATTPDGGEAMGEDQLRALHGDTGTKPAAVVGVLVRVPTGRGGRIAGYGQLMRHGAGIAGEVVLPAVPGEGGRTGVPGARERQEVAAALLDGLLEAAPALGGGRLELWWRNSASSDGALAAAAGLSSERTLEQLRHPLPLGSGPAAVVTRAFRPGEDEQAFLAVNARAFAALPDQGGWTLDTLLEREQQPWFDPQGFLLHEEDDQLVAFCWTRLHVHPRLLGEIYVIAVDPGAQQHGLGRAMLAAGCERLHSVGAPEVMLYVDAANAAGLALYRSAGFTLHHEDRSYVVELAASTEPAAAKRPAAGTGPADPTGGGT